LTQGCVVLHSTGYHTGIWQAHSLEEVQELALSHTVCVAAHLHVVRTPGSSQVITLTPCCSVRYTTTCHTLLGGCLQPMLLLLQAETYVVSAVSPDLREAEFEMMPTAVVGPAGSDCQCGCCSKTAACSQGACLMSSACTLIYHSHNGPRHSCLDEVVHAVEPCLRNHGLQLTGGRAVVTRHKAAQAATVTQEDKHTCRREANWLKYSMRGV